MPALHSISTIHRRVDHATADLLIAVEPIGDRPALSDARLLGQRTLNRFQRMELAVQSGVSGCGVRFAAGR